MLGSTVIRVGGSEEHQHIKSFSVKTELPSARLFILPPMIIREWNKTVSTQPILQKHSSLRLLQGEQSFCPESLTLSTSMRTEEITDKNMTPES